MLKDWSVIVNLRVAYVLAGASIDGYEMPLSTGQVRNVTVESKVDNVNGLHRQ